jgi:hypothetical protein
VTNRADEANLKLAEASITKARPPFISFSSSLFSLGAGPGRPVGPPPWGRAERPRRGRDAWPARPPFACGSSPPPRGSTPPAGRAPAPSARAAQVVRLYNNRGQLGFTTSEAVSKLALPLPPGGLPPGGALDFPGASLPLDPRMAPTAVGRVRGRAAAAARAPRVAGPRGQARVACWPLGLGGGCEPYDAAPVCFVVPSSAPSGTAPRFGAWRAPSFRRFRASSHAPRSNDPPPPPQMVKITFELRLDAKAEGLLMSGTTLAAPLAISRGRPPPRRAGPGGKPAPAASPDAPPPDKPAPPAGWGNPQKLGQALYSVDDQGAARNVATQAQFDALLAQLDAADAGGGGGGAGYPAIR